MSLNTVGIVDIFIKNLYSCWSGITRLINKEIAMRKNVVLMRHSIIWSGSGGQHIGELTRDGFEKVGLVIEWLKTNSIGTCVIYTSPDFDPRETTKVLSAGIPHVKNETCDLLGGRCSDQAIGEIGKFLEAEDKGEGYDTIVLVTHEPVIREFLLHPTTYHEWGIESRNARQIPHATAVLLKPDHTYKKFCPR
jgi:phosphohistidine phosphatase SixA